LQLAIRLEEGGGLLAGAEGAAALETEKSFPRPMGHEDLWMLKAVLDEDQSLGEQSLIPVDEKRGAA
jgi:hypothetical protein